MASGDGINWLIEALRSLPWKRPNIGSRMNREVHVRIWERPEVRVLRATRHEDHPGCGRFSNDLFGTNRFEIFSLLFCQQR